MGRKVYTPEQIIGKLREAEVLLGQRHTRGQVTCSRPSDMVASMPIMWHHEPVEGPRCIDRCRRDTHSSYYLLSIMGRAMRG